MADAVQEQLLAQSTRIPRTLLGGHWRRKSFLTDPFQPLNVLGVIKEVRTGGMFKVEIECGERLVVKFIFGGQMVLFKEKQCELPLCETPSKLSLLNMLNLISEFGLAVRKEMYNRR